MNAAEQFSYDQVLYPGNPFAHTHPDHLATILSLHGATPAPIAGGRVLELGCGNGGNIIPMACQRPETEFVGIDLSQRAVEAGQEIVRRLGLSNIKLQYRNIMDLSDADGRFDYIIAHGVYSWVPQFVRDKILSIFNRNLSPQGVAYVSYNAFPGAHLRNLARSLMLFHVRGITDPRERAAQSRGLMKLLADAGRKDELYGFILRDQFERIKDLKDEVFIHDDLDEGSAAFFLYQVVEDAAAQGLQYVADAEFPELREHGYSPEVGKILSQVPESEFLIREQYFDFIDGRAFRKSLFCHHDVALRRPLVPQNLKDYYLTTTIAPPTGDIDLASRQALEFKSHQTATLKTDHPLSKAAFVVLAHAQPQALAFADLIRQSCVLLDADAPAPGAALEREVEVVTSIMFQAFRARLVQLRCEPLRLTTSISTRPVASPFARFQAGTSPLVTNLAHGSVMLEDDIARRFVSLLDGTRDLDQLCADLRASVPRETADADEAANPKVVRANLAMLAKCALLAA